MQRYIPYSTVNYVQCAFVPFSLLLLCMFFSTFLVNSRYKTYLGPWQFGASVIDVNTKSKYGIKSL